MDHLGLLSRSGYRVLVDGKLVRIRAVHRR